MLARAKLSCRDFVLIANPAASKGETIVTEAYQSLLAEGCTGRLELTVRSGDAQQIARKAVADGSRWVIACGGDGTIHEVVNAIAEKPDVILGILPCGRGNDFARALKIPTKPVEAIKTLLNGVVRRIDLGKIGAHYFVTIVTCGYDAYVSQRVAEKGAPFHGTASYIYTAITSLFSYQPPVACLAGDFGLYEGKILLAATGITSSYGGGIKMLPRAIADDGLFDVCIVKSIACHTALRMLPTLFWGGHIGHHAVQMCRTKSLTIQTEPPTLLYADGEQICHTPATIEMVERALTVITPPAFMEKETHQQL